jgi:hypothetical protein
MLECQRSKLGKSVRLTKWPRIRPEDGTIIPTGIGSDYARFCKGEKPALVEVKSGTGKLTSAQKITKSTVTKVGWNYVEERCD